MKSLLPLATAFLLLCSNASAQTGLNQQCGTMPSLEFRLQNDPGLQQRIAERKRQLRSTGEYDTTGHLVIPVVFHVVYDPASPEQNIHDSLIFSQIQVLNNDYSYTHAGISTTLPVFDSLTGHTGIEFKLATVDPMGNPTNGITRTSSSTNHFLTPITNSVKGDGSGGKDPWPTDQYLNIWVCSMFPGLLGYATFPGDDPDMDGVVLAYDYVGARPGAPTAPNNLGRTATHECGHWLNMRHVWGDGGCGIDDMVDDTPDSDAASSSDCQLSRNDCDDAGNLFWHGSNPPDMVQNFMDYSADACMTLFTRGQIHRMWRAIVENRFNLFHSTGCGTPTLNGYVVTQNITCGQSCDGSAAVTVVEGTAPFSYLWDTPGADITPSVTGLCKGVYTVRVIDADNDTMYIDAYVKTTTSLTAVVTDVTGASCDTCTTGTIVIDAMGGNPAYTYAVNGGTPQNSGTIEDLAPGDYTITVSDSCSSQVELEVTIEDVSGVFEHNHENALLIYPNPAQEIVTVELKANNSRLKTLVLIDALGRPVKTIQNNGRHAVNLQLNDLAAGLYTLTATVENGTQFSGKLLITNR